MSLGGRSKPEVTRRGRLNEEAVLNTVVAPGRNSVNSEITARHSPDAPSIPTPEQAGQGSMAPMETKTGRLSRTRTTIRAMTRARCIRGSLPATRREAVSP
jgi:hypothetical protein